MVVEVRKTLVWATALASVASAMLLTSTGGGMPRIGGDFARARVAAPKPPNTSAVPTGRRDRVAPEPAGSAR